MKDFIDYLKRLTQNKSAKNVIWILSERFIQMLISFFVTIISMSYLGPSNFGLISYVTSITALFTAVVNLGINNILIKRLVQNREKNGDKTTKIQISLPEEDG